MRTPQKLDVMVTSSGTKQAAEEPDSPDSPERLSWDLECAPNRYASLFGGCAAAGRHLHNPVVISPISQIRRKALKYLSEVTRPRARVEI